MKGYLSSGQVCSSFQNVLNKCSLTQGRMEHPMIHQENRSIRRRPAKNLEDILARLEKRQQAPRTYAPDFLHGDFKLEEVYIHQLGERIESCGFVLLTEEGVFVARLEDHFLTIFHHAELEKARTWLASLGEDISNWVIYNQRESESILDWSHLPGQVATLELSWSDFLDAEARILGVWRDDNEQSSSMRAKHEATLLSMIGILTRNANLGSLTNLDKAA